MSNVPKMSSIEEDKHSKHTTVQCMTVYWEMLLPVSVSRGFIMAPPLKETNGNQFVQFVKKGIKD